MEAGRDLPVLPSPSTVLDCTLRRQVQIPDWLYQELAERLCEAIGSRNHFSDTVSLDAGRVTCCLTAELIVYRRWVSAPDGGYEQICDLVPTWWEFHTQKDGEALPNDFKFSELRRYLTN